MSNRRKRQEKVAPQRRITVTEKNKHQAALTLGYTIEEIDDFLSTAIAEGYAGVSIPIPPER